MSAHNNTKDEDRAIAKNVRSAMARINLDITELNVSCRGGYIELDGKVRGPRGEAGTVNVRREFNHMITVARTVRGVKDVQPGRVAIYD